MTLRIDWSNEYQVVDMNWFKGNSVMMTVVTYYWQMEEGIKWIDKRRVMDKLKSCRKFTNPDSGVWYVDAPPSMSDENIRMALRALINGNTIKVRASV